MGDWEFRVVFTYREFKPRLCYRKPSPNAKIKTNKVVKHHQEARAWFCIPIISELGRLRQVDHHLFEASLSYLRSCFKETKSKK